MTCPDRWLVTVWTCTTVCPWTIAQPDNQAEFEAWARSRLPSVGAWSAVYVPPEPDRFLELHVGYEWVSGAWFEATGTGATGADGDGRLYYLGSDLREEPTIRGEDQSGCDAGLDDNLPTPLLRHLLDHPESMRSVDQAPDAGYAIVVRWPNGSRDPESAVPGAQTLDVTLVFDARGRLIDRRYFLDQSLFAWEYTYDDRCPPEFAIPASVTRRFKSARAEVVTSLVLVEWRPVGADSFQTPAVRIVSSQAAQATRESIARRQRVLSESVTPEGAAAVGALRSSDLTTSAPAASDSQGVPPAPPALGLGRYRWPLIITGVLVVGIAIYARARRSAP